MNRQTLDRLEAAGYRMGDAGDFLELTEEERRLVDLRAVISRAIRRQRGQKRMTQKQLAAKMKSSQSRVAKIESASADVSLDLSFRAFFILGGNLRDILASVPDHGEAHK